MFATDYRGLIVVEAVRVGPQTLQMVRPGDPEAMLDDPAVLELNRQTDYMPYWAFLWPGAYLLAEAVARRTWTAGTEALELGCGLGLAGLAGLTRGLRVEFTDYDQAPLRFVERSAAANGFSPGDFRTRRLDWRNPAGPRVPVILGADVLYERRLVPLVCGVIRERLTPDGEALVAGPYRVASDDLESRLNEFGLTAQSEPIEATTLEAERVRGVLHCIRRA